MLFTRFSVPRCSCLLLLGLLVGACAPSGANLTENNAPATAIPPMTAAEYLTVAETLFEAEDYEEVRPLLDLALEQEPLLVEAHRLRKEAEIRAVDQPTLAELDQVIEADSQRILAEPDQAEAYVSRGLSRIRRTIVAGEPTIAEVIDPNTVRIQTFDEPLELKRYDLAEAIADFDQALELDPEMAAAFHGRGLAHNLQGLRYRGLVLFDYEPDELELALRDYDQAISLDPELADAYHDRGTVYAQRAWLDEKLGQLLTYGDEERAESLRDGALVGLELAAADFESVLALTPDHELALQNSAHTYMLLSGQMDRLGDEEGKMDSMRRSALAGGMLIAVNPDNLWGYYYRSTMLDLARRWGYDELVDELAEVAAEDERIYMEKAYSSKQFMQAPFMDFWSRIYVLSDGPPTFPPYVTRLLSGTLDDDFYSLPDASWQLDLPPIFNPPHGFFDMPPMVADRLIWDASTAYGRWVIYIEDSLARWYLLQTVPKTSSSPAEWLQQHLGDVTGEEVLDPAAITTYRLLDPPAECSVGLKDLELEFLVIQYCLLDDFPGQDAELNARIFGLLSEVQIAPTDLVVGELINDVVDRP